MSGRIGGRMAYFDEQTQMFVLFTMIFVLLVWGKIRYDLVAFGALILAAALGLVPSEDVFSGFGHSAVAIIALVLIVSRGLSSSGAVELVAARIVKPDRPLPLHIAMIGGVGAVLSAIINNVAALALLMPLDIEAANKAKRVAGQSLMPLSFATILGGMVTLIGTPPNIVISEYRQDVLGAPFGMFDFTPVGLTVAVAGIAFVSLIGWRLLPDRAGSAQEGQEIRQGRYVAELKVGELKRPGSSKDASKDSAKAEESADAKNTKEPEDIRVAQLYSVADEVDVHILGLIRDGKRRPGFASKEILRAGDFLVVEGEPKAIEAFMGKTALEFAGSEKHEGGVMAKGLTLQEAIVPDTARISGRTARSLGLLHRHSVTLLGVAREGHRFRDRVRLLPIRAGDVLLLLGTPERVANVVEWLGVLPIEGRRTEVIQR